MNRLLALSLVLFVAAPAAADVVVERHPPHPAQSARLTALHRVRTDAPAADAEAVLAETRRELGAGQARIDAGLRGLDLREDPLRSRARTLSGRIVFERSGRPSVRVQRAQGLPAAARGCIEEAVRAIAVRTAPRGVVELRFTYTLGARLRSRPW